MNSKEIAELAGVSRSTVSRVINNHPSVEPETRERILKIIEEQNYVPMQSARTLAGKTPRILGLFVVDIHESNVKVPQKSCSTVEKRISKSSYFSVFVNNIVEEADRFDYNILISIITSVEQFKSVKNLFLNKTIAGGIFIGVKNNDENINELIDLKFKIVVVNQNNRSSEVGSRCIFVNLDNFGGAYLATKYLIELGYKEIAHIYGDLDKFSGKARYEGYKKALEDFNIKPKRNLMVKGNFMEESGYKAAKKLFSNNRPPAVFVANDSMAIGALKYFKEMGIRVPEDVSIVGFDDIEALNQLTPPLTTVKAAFNHMGSICVESIINAIEKDLNIEANYVIPVELIIRESCKVAENL